jgi:hypothetical protein
MRTAKAKELAFHIIVNLKAVFSTDGIENPIPDIHQIQQTAEFLLRQVDLHSDPSF